MGPLPLGGEGGALGYAEAVLFVGDHQPQVLEGDALAEERVGAGEHPDLPPLQALQDLPPGLGGHGPGQQGAGDAQALQQCGEPPVVLLGEDFCGGHQRRLKPVFHGADHRRRGHHGLAGAHIPLDQPVHGLSGGEVGQNLADGPPLGPGEVEGQFPIERRQVQVPVGRAGAVLPAAAELPDPYGQEEQLLKGQTPPGHVQLLLAGGEMDLLIGVLHPAELVILEDLVRQGVLQQVSAGGKPLVHRPDEHGLGDPGGEGVDGHDAPGEHPRPRRFHQGVDHGLAPPGTLRLAVEDVVLPGMEAVFAVALVEKGEKEGPGPVGDLHLHQLHPLAHPVQGGRLVHHGLHAGALPVLEGADLPDAPAVLIGPGEVGDEVPQGDDAQLFEALGPLLADAPDIADIRAQVRHGPPAFRAGARFS